MDAAIDAAEIDASIELHNYEETILVALQEVVDALADVYHQRQIYAVRNDEFANAQELLDLSRFRFEAGSDDFIDLLDAQRTLFAANDALIRSKRDYLNAAINTYRSMGVFPVTDTRIE